MSQIIKGHNKKIIQKENEETLDCNCRVKTDCPLNGGCRKESVIYKCTATTCDSKKVYLGLTEGEFKRQRYYNHVKSFKNEYYANSTTLSSHVWELKKKKKKCNSSSYMGSLTDGESIFQYNKKVFFMPPRETSDHHLSISGRTS